MSSSIGSKFLRAFDILIAVEEDFLASYLRASPVWMNSH